MIQKFLTNFGGCLEGWFWRVWVGVQMTPRCPADHCLSQHGVWVPFWTPKPLKRTPQDTQFFLCGISKNLNPIIEFFHLLIVPMTLLNDIIPYSDEFIHVYGWNMSILWSPLKIWTPQNFKTANFRHPVSKSGLRHCCRLWLWMCVKGYVYSSMNLLRPMACCV